MKEILDTPERMVSRKNDHIAICATQNVESGAQNTVESSTQNKVESGGAFSSIHLVPEALPECDLLDIDTTCSFLGTSFKLPLLITGMTGGVQKGQEINETLAYAAQKFGIPMGLGSQKLMIRRPEFQTLFDVRKKVPGVFTLGNLGAVSFNYGITLDDVKRLVDTLELSAFALHLNALQECIQPEGERNFGGLLKIIESCAKSLPVPVMVKEVGSGMSAITYLKLADCGVAAVDVGGSGGTSWSVIEGLRSNSEGQRLGELFRNWGFSTESSLLQCAAARKLIPSNTLGKAPEFNKGAGFGTAGVLGPQLVATGGIRNGIEVAKAVACGATLAGVGLPLFRKVTHPEPGFTPFESLCNELEFFSKSLRIAMFCCGAPTLNDLQSRMVFKVIQKDLSDDK